MSKTFIVILVVIIVGVAYTMFGINQNKDIIPNYEASLEACGLNLANGFTEEELLSAQKCACKNGDQASCNFVNLQQ